MVVKIRGIIIALWQIWAASILLKQETRSQTDKVQTDIVKRLYIKAVYNEIVDITK